MKGVFGKLLAVFALAVVLMPFAVAEQGTITISHQDNLTVLTLDLKKGEAVDFSWSANSSVRFRIENTTGTTFVDRTGQTGSGNWEVPADGTYTFDFRNETDIPVTVQWTINHQSPLTLFYFLVALVVGVAAIGTFLALRKKRSST